MKTFATRPIDYRATLIIAFACTALGYFAQRELLAGNGLHNVLAAAIAVGLPLLALLAWRRPMVFPFCAYVALVPFDNLLVTGIGDTLTKILAIVAGVALLLYMAIRRSAVAPTRSVFVWFVLLLWMGTTIFWAIDQNAATETFSRYAQLFLLFALVGIYPVNLADMRMVIAAAIAGACAASLYGTYLFLSGTGDFDSRLYVSAGNSHIDPNHFAASLLMPLALATMLALRMKTWQLKALAIVPVAILVAGLYMSESRGAFAAAGAMLAFLILFSRHRIQAIIGSIVGVVAIPPAFMARMQIAGSSGGSGRLDIWRSALAAFKEHWLAGAGIGNFPTAYDSVYLAVSHLSFFSWHMQAHNLIAQSAVELGIIGLAIMLVAWITQFRDARMLQQSEIFEDLALALQAGILALFVASLFLDIMWSKYTWLAFMIVMLARNALVVISQRRPLGVMQHL